MFVIKTVDDAGRKVFVNFCGHAKIAAPGTKWGKGDAVPEEVQKALVSMEEGSNEGVEHLRFPISVSEGRNELDKSGHGCTVYDAVFNEDVAKQAAHYKRLKVFVCELCLQGSDCNRRRCDFVDRTVVSGRTRKRRDVTQCLHRRSRRRRN